MEKGRCSQKRVAILAAPTRNLHWELGPARNRQRCVGTGVVLVSSVAADEARRSSWLTLNRTRKIASATSGINSQGQKGCRRAVLLVSEVFSGRADMGRETTLGGLHGQ